MRSIGLDELCGADDGKVTEEYVADTDPAGWAVCLSDYTAFVDAAGVEVGEDEIDWETEDEPDEQPEEGLRYAATVTEANRWEAEFYCRTAPEAVGLHLTGCPPLTTPTPWLRAMPPVPNRPRASAKSGAGSEPSTSWARRRSRCDAAGFSRRCSRRPRPRARLARIISANPFLFDDYQGKRTTAELLGAHPRELVDALPANAGDNRGLMILLGIVLGALEAHTPTHPSALREPRLLSTGGASKPPMARRPSMVRRLGGRTTPGSTRAVKRGHIR